MIRQTSIGVMVQESPLQHPCTACQQGIEDLSFCMAGIQVWHRNKAIRQLINDHGGAWQKIEYGYEINFGGRRERLSVQCMP